MERPQQVWKRKAGGQVQWPLSVQQWYATRADPQGSAAGMGRGHPEGLHLLLHEPCGVSVLLTTATYSGLTLLQAPT